MKKKKLVIGLLILCFILAALFMFYTVYQKIFSVAIQKEAPEYLYVPTGMSYVELLEVIEKENVIKDIQTFKQLAKYKKLSQKYKAGRYRLQDDMSINDLANMLRSGNQEAVKLIFNHIRTKEQLVQKISKQLELDANDLLNLLNDSVFLAKYNLNTQTVISIFIPNTYEFWWNTSATGFFERMYSEYEKFWNKERVSKAKEIGLSPLQVIILASIVEEENYRTDEQARIAGVYMNRLKKGMLLQADPTIKFVLGDFSIKRLLYKDLEIDSPYNTYMYTGLPPGPIRIPERSAINAVLNYEKHNFLYMCAKEDFSGYHNFAVSARQHAINAKKYQHALNKLKINR
ncbi:MAG: endolytic transglycosylase MltG [Bacteroidales bacterium]|nr:endolytic transglycosylase MltG [Bacteroidales bacterium]